MGHTTAFSQGAVQQSMKKSRFTNAFMMSVPGDPLWMTYQSFMEDPSQYEHVAKTLFKGIRHWDIMTAAGPTVLNEVVKATKRRDLIGTIPNFLTQPSPHWHARPFIQDGNSGESMVEILEGGSWHTWDSRLTTEMDHIWYERDVWMPIALGVSLVFAIVFIVLFVKAKAKLATAVVVATV